ncbi:MAG: EFR1 family ferrodoxin [Candidatus Omnitrophota bacterium]|nr:EFR1 family ferrodoxin [Candidatus Omnitrophota bacterium]
MKTAIFYFSATGNCFTVARDLAEALGDTQIISIPKASAQVDLSAFERVGIIYPVYMFGMPLIVADFIKKLKPAGGKYIFAVATYGGKPGSALKQTARLLKEEGFKLSAGFGILMPGNYTPLYGAIPEDKQQGLFVKEKEKIGHIAGIILRGEICNPPQTFFLFSWLGWLLYKLCSPKIPVMDTKFRSTDRCNGCGVCVRVCPAANIELSSARPKWLHRCQQCMACLQWCPQQAIEYGKSTIGRKRYHHPSVKLEDMLM